MSSRMFSCLHVSSVLGSGSIVCICIETKGTHLCLLIFFIIIVIGLRRSEVKLVVCIRDETWPEREVMKCKSFSFSNVLCYFY